MTKAELSTEEVGARKPQNLRCECCESLLLSKEYTFKNVSKAFTLKTRRSCNSFIFIYVLNCSGCLEEYNGEMGVGKPRLRDRIIVYRERVKQPEHQRLKKEKHIQICGVDSFKTFLFLQMRSNDTNDRI